MDLARGEMNMEQIAAKHGLSASMVCAIMKGARRPELREKVIAISETMLEQTKAMGRRLAAQAMDVLGRLAAKDSTAPAETRRKAAVDIMRFAMGDPSATQVNVNQQQQSCHAFSGLDADDIALIAKRHGGEHLSEEAK